MRRSALLLSLGLSANASVGCATETETDQTVDAVTTEVLQSKQDFFSEPMLFVRITGWSGDPDSLREAAESVRQGDAELQIYKTNPQSAEHCPSTGNALVYKSKAFKVRTSGNFTNGTPKSSYKLSLEDDDDRLFGMKALNLKSMWNDVSQMREAIAWRMFAAGGVVASRHTYAKLCVDGRKNGQGFTKYMGLYSLIEQVDKSMLKDAYGKKNNDGNLYKAYWPENDLGPATLAYRRADNGDDSGKQYRKNPSIDERTYQLKTNDGRNDDRSLQTYDDLAKFIRVINGVTTRGDDAAKFTTAEYASAVTDVFNANEFLRWAAINTLLGAWDNYWATPANYYLYNSGKKDAGDAFMTKPYFNWVPWDYDNILGIGQTGANWASSSIVDFPSYNGQGSNIGSLPLLRHLFKNDAFFGYYLDAIEHFNDTLFTVEGVMSSAGRMRTRVQTAAFLEGNFGDPSHTGRQFTNDEVTRHGFEHNELLRGTQFILGIEHFVRIRHDSVIDQVRRLRRGRNLARGSSGATFPAQREELPR